ncbi:His-Xaa-Ser repeat protein HxsA2 [Variovorax sp. LjRoot178]|uniref:His-Xaa-Ser repeat protein HxsA2 n=1 Tax=Variovorax sp. LjRoot178 TaxID=3342277 RepID=UPI003F51377F
MTKATFLIPMAAATASLIGGAAYASAPAQVKQSANLPAASAATQGAGGLVLGYVRGDEQHQMLMKRDDSGTVLAYHQSHSSHYSHSSHASHRSSAY